MTLKTRMKAALPGFEAYKANNPGVITPPQLQPVRRLQKSPAKIPNPTVMGFMLMGFMLMKKPTTENLHKSVIVQIFPSLFFPLSPKLLKFVRKSKGLNSRVAHGT
jgi:hypothetical protein